jgi:glycosyltransferase involved in cell wall biosynthesis
MLPIGIQDHVPDSIVHFPQITGCAMMLWRPVRPAVATVHDLGVLVCEEDAQLFSPSARRILDLQIAGLKRVDYFAVNSERTKVGLVEILAIPEERIRYVPLGIDTDHFRYIPDAWPQIPERYAIRPIEGVVDLLYVGSELPRKNLGLLLQAMAILKQQDLRVRLIKIGGPGGQQWRDELLTQVERLHLHDEVVFAGIVSEDDLPLFLSIADLCVTPTKLEGGFAWLAKAAMACGKPFVATEDALIPDDAQDAGLVVKSQDPRELASAIATFLESPERRRAMGQIGRERIMKYNWEATAQAMVEVYRLAIQGGAR